VTSLACSLLLWGLKLFTTVYSDGGEHGSGTIGLILRRSPEFRISNLVGSDEVGPPERQTYLSYGNVCDGYFGDRTYPWLADVGYACSSLLTVALFVVWSRNREEIEASSSLFGWLRTARGRSHDASRPSDPGLPGA
jgi:hypothetical protein